MIEHLIRNFLYYPVRLERSAPLPPYVRGAREVFVKSSDGNEIHGLFWPPREGRPTVLFFHGNAQSVFEWALIREDLHALDCGLYLIDYPGYGKSTGTPSEVTLYAAAEAAYRQCLELSGPSSPLILFGKSLGGGVATWLASRFPARGMILESTFSSVPAVARRLFPILPESFLFRSERYDSLSRISALLLPLLIVHGTADELIPLEQGESLYQAALGPKEMYRVQGAGHNDVAMCAGANYGRTLRSWLDRILSQ